VRVPTSCDALSVRTLAYILGGKTGHLARFSDIHVFPCESLSNVRRTSQMSGATQHKQGEYA
jgi:hypothetical protein